VFISRFAARLQEIIVTSTPSVHASSIPITAGHTPWMERALKKSIPYPQQPLVVENSSRAQLWQRTLAHHPVTRHPPCTRVTGARARCVIHCARFSLSGVLQETVPWIVHYLNLDQTARGRHANVLETEHLFLFSLGRGAVATTQSSLDEHRSSAPQHAARRATRTSYRSSLARQPPIRIRQGDRRQRAHAASVAAAARGMTFGANNER